MADTDGSNIEPTMEEIRKGHREVVALKEERKAINDKIAAVRSHLETLGIRKEAFDMALRYMTWDEDKRSGFDLAYSIVRESLGAPVEAQGDLEDFIKGKNGEGDGDG